MWFKAVLLALLCAGSALAAAVQPPCVYGVDAPELAPLGPYPVGVKTLRLVQAAQIDVLEFAASGAISGVLPRHDRVLNVDLWYPAGPPAAGSVAAVYTASFPGEPPSPPTRFSVQGIAVRDAPPAGTHHPWVIVSHGYSNDPAAMTWLTENLASKGYVVAAIRHDDPPITDRAKFIQPLLRRPLDIAFVAESLRKTLGAQHMVDPARLGLIGYSMGGYGVLTAAGATLDPHGPPTTLIPGNVLMPFTRGANLQDALTVKAPQAVVAISPAGGGTLAAWGPEGLHGITAPLLLIAGDTDRTVDYASGARAIFESAVNAHRYLLTFKGGGHSIGLNPAPQEMRHRLWDQDWFEDPVWRKERINAINAHFITAFLDLYLKGDATRAAYLRVAVTDSTLGAWVAQPPPAYDAYSPGGAGMTLWKGFQSNHAAGLELLQAGAAGAPASVDPSPPVAAGQ